MGLDCSHDAYRGGYVSFNRMRRAVCEALGGSWEDHVDPDMDPDKWYAPLEFDAQKYAGVVLFLNHSDCDGEFAPHECALVARDLRKVLSKVSEKYAYGHLARVGGVRAAVEKFCVGCDRAAQADEPLTFR